MKQLLIFLALATLIACAPKGGDTNVAPIVPVPTPVVVQPTPVPTATPAPTATPVPTPTPVATYNCTNHPLSNTTLNDAAGNYSFKFNSDCTSVFTDSTHISYGHWLPDPDMSHVVHSTSYFSYPVNLTTTGAYICLPANGPQNCSNYGYVGNVIITLHQGKITITY